MSRLLFVRSEGLFAHVLPDVNRFLQFVRSKRIDAGGFDPLLGVCFCEALELALPASLDDAVRLRESTTVAGLWSLDWGDGEVVPRAGDHAERRLRLVDALVAPVAGSPLRFRAAFGVDDPPVVIAAALHALAVRHPRIVLRGWYLDDRTRGLVKEGGEA